MAKKHWVLAAGGIGAAGLGVVALCFGSVFGVPCLSTGVSYGLWLDTCPAGTPALSAYVSASGLVRGGTGRVRVEPSASYVFRWDDADQIRSSRIHRGFQSTLTLLDDDDQPVDGVVFERKRRGVWSVSLPDIPDGNYTLRTAVTAGFGEQTVDMQIPLFTPAIAFVQTDRPLYQPGQDVQLRGVLLERTTLEPIDDRPAQWTITSPSGQQMLVEDDRAGAYGVVDTRFPLDRFAENGQWTAQLTSGDSTDAVTFDVRPFKLPRVQADLTADARWYGIGGQVRLTGRATYTSGAPIAQAPVSVNLVQTSGRWPMPLEWAEPFTTTTDAQGRFEVDVGEVPADLIEHSALTAVARITEAAGEVATGSAPVRISLDDIRVQAITELGGGLVQGANNRVWLRVTTPDGRALPGAQVSVTNPWNDETPRQAVADADGVASIQLDPGPPVSVRTPAAPIRVPEIQADPVSLQNGTVLGGGSLTLADRRALETALPALGACQDLTTTMATASVALRVDASGRITRSIPMAGAVSECAEQAMRTVRLPSGRMRTLSVDWRVPPSLRPTLRAETTVVLNDTIVRSVSARFDEAALRARRCVPTDVSTQASLFRLNWTARDQSTALQLEGRSNDANPGVSRSVVDCVAREFERVRLTEEATRDALGALTVSVVPAPRRTIAEPQPTVHTGYELMVSAAVGDAAEQEVLGETRLVLSPGRIPALRLRATPSLPAPGDTLAIEAVRGPGFSGSLPEEIRLMQGTRELAKVDLDPDTRTAEFVIPQGTRGFVHVSVGSARALAFVSESDPLSVAVTADQPTYRPGETATLTVSTRSGGRGVPAGVGLGGVDASLGQLGTLLGPDAMSRVTVRAESSDKAFGQFGAAALAMGQIRGEYAAQAALLTVDSVPMDVAGDTRVDGYADRAPSATEVLLEPFFRARGRLVQRVGEWEDTAPEGEVLMPADVAAHWVAVLDAEEADGAPIVDLYGRPLTLSRLPRDLLAQLAPNALVTDRTRVPEDMIDWERWVASEVR